MDAAEIFDSVARQSGLRRLDRENLPPGPRKGYDQVAADAEELIASAKAMVPACP
jgi:hypothetical protein